MWLWSLLLSFPLSLAVRGPHGPKGPEGDGELHCGPRGLRFTVQPPGLGTGAPPALIVWGKSADSPGCPKQWLTSSTTYNLHPLSFLANTVPVANSTASL